MYAQISPGGAGRDRLFFVPSEECHNKGKEFVVKIVNILTSRTIFWIFTRELTTEGLWGGLLKSDISTYKKWEYEAE